MPPFKITVIVPSISSAEKIPLVESFKQSTHCDEMELQFVILQNAKKTDIVKPSSIEKHTGYEIVRVQNDRYFGSCEENIYRAQDFVDAFHDYVFCVGEHDVIDWALMLEGLHFFEDRQLDAMGWDIMNVQSIGGGESVSLSCFVPVSQSHSSSYVNMLLNGNTLPSSIAYPSLLATYGPIDWAAYLGNHLFRKSILKKIFQYRFSEHVYSFVFKQLKFFSSSDVRYGLFNKCVIQRVSSDFLNLKNANGSKKITWLEEHRLVHGASPVLWVSNLSHMLELENSNLFNLISNSLCMSHYPDAKYEIEFKYHSFLHNVFMWSAGVIQHKLFGTSYYFPGIYGSSYLTDLLHVKRYFERMLKIFEFQDFSVNEKQLKLAVIDVVFNLQAYLDRGIHQDALLVSTAESLRSATTLLSNEYVFAASNESFNRYQNSLIRRP